MNIEDDFRALTGFAPLAWQARLYGEYFAAGVLPSAVDVPTGLGKTSVMALWLIARARGASLPRRLVYVVDRRVVVDQATDEAMKLRSALDGDAAHLKALLALNRTLPISTLRGKFQDNREWREDPAASAIIVGTVDMIGSRLLFEGYGVSRKMRSYHAGLLGVDALVVLDEAHLVPPFQHLLRSIEKDAPGWCSKAAPVLVPPLRILPLSATQREVTQSGAVFRLERRDWETDDIARKRLYAKKRLRFCKLAEKHHNKQLAEEAWRLANANGPKRVIVFCTRRRKQDEGDGPSAEGVKDEIESRAQTDRKAGRAATEIDIQLLVGGRRQRERDQLADWLRENGFVAGEGAPAKPTFLIATSAGEVGVDIDADHMVSDLAPWERMVQRLGRVNRKGQGDAEIAVFWSEPKEADLRAQIAFAAWHALAQLTPLSEGAFDASPAALRALSENAEHKTDIANAITPEPLRPALNLPLVEAWSMTSLEEHTGRPEVAPWLRGWVEETPQTTLLWRAHLPVWIESLNGRNRSVVPPKKETENFFEAAPPHDSEKLETETYHVVDWLSARAAALLTTSPQPRAEVPAAEDDEDAGGARDKHLETNVENQASEQPLGADDIAAIALTPAGEAVRAYKLRELSVTKKEKDDLKRAFEGKTLVLDARFGGLDKHGLLDAGRAEPPETADTDDDWSAANEVRVRRLTAKPEREENWRPELDFVTRRDADGAPTDWLVVEHFCNAARVEDARALAKTAQTLEQHASWAEMRAATIADALSLQGNAKETLLIATRLHDEGKRAARWQKAFRAARDAHQFSLDGPLAKTCGPINHAILDGYRHEFGSLPYVENHPRFLALSGEWRDLVLHLVAAHHGQARPLIETRSCEDAPPSALEDRAREVALRFARLQRRWGPWGLAWWEALLRAADQQASRALEETQGKESR